MQKSAFIGNKKEAKTTIIYESQGRAREYSELAANLYSGCDHGCVYCYAPLVTRKSREDFHHPTVRKNVMQKFWHDAKELERIGETRFILLSFTTDPYQKLDEDVQLTRQAIKILHSCNLKVSILTKGGSRSERDFDLLSANPELSQYGASLVFTDEEMRKKIEPWAASTQERINALKKAHDLGIFTYVSLEPVWFPNESIELIKRTNEFVDFYKVGVLNYNSQRNAINWKKFHGDVIDILDKYGKKYYIKNDLKKY